MSCWMRSCVLLASRASWGACSCLETRSRSASACGSVDGFGRGPCSACEGAGCPAAAARVDRVAADLAIRILVGPHDGGTIILPIIRAERAEIANEARRIERRVGIERARQRLHLR